MKLSRTVGLAVSLSLVSGAVAALAQISRAAPADPTANVVDAAGHLRVPADYRTLYRALGNWAVVADSGQGSKEMHVVYASRDRRRPEGGALPRRRRSGERDLRDLDRRDDHRDSKLRRQAQGLVRRGERQQEKPPRQPVVGRRVGMVVVRRGQAAKDHLDRLPFRLPGALHAR